MAFKLTVSNPAATGTRGSEIELVQELRSLRDSDRSDAEKRSLARQNLKTARSSMIRNAAALALSDLKAVDAVPILVDMLLEPGVAAQGGTLLYAIEELEGDMHLGAFVHVLVNGSYGARQQALDLLVAGHVVDDDPDTFDDRLRRIEDLICDDNREKAAAASETLAILQAPAERNPPA